jgi:hypothetical protein
MSFSVRSNHEVMLPLAKVLPAFNEIGVARSALIGIFLIPFLKLFPFTDSWKWPKYAHAMSCITEDRSDLSQIYGSLLSLDIPSQSYR